MLLKESRDFEGVCLVRLTGIVDHDGGTESIG